jgi:hypothetical protein
MSALGAGIHRRTVLKAMGGAAAMAPVWGVLRANPAFAQADVDARKDLQRIVAGLDFDTQQIFRYVADEVAYDPYAGVMRGATGTLRSLAGSSADQALLLAALLSEAQVGYRFAIGRLDDAVASTMLEGASLSVEQAAQRAATTLLSPEAKDAWSGSGAWRRAPEVDQLIAQARDRADATVATLQAALAGAGVELPSGTPTLPDVERDRHVWLQYASGPEWIDLDPSVPGAEPGTAYATVTETLDELPDDLHHRVTITATAEVVEADVPTRKELLSQTLRVADLVGAPISMAHPTAEWLGVGSAISGQQTYAPALLVGDRVVEGSTFALDTGGGVGGALGQPGDLEGQAIAEWLAIDLAIPGGIERHAERTVFDRVDPIQRAAGAIDLSNIGPVELVDLGEDERDQYLPLVGMITLSVAPAPVPWQLYDDDATGETQQLELESQVAHAFPYLRDLVRLETLGDRVSPRFIDDEPSVTAFWARPTELATGDGLVRVEAAVDIVHARHSALPLSDADVPVPAGLLAGALDHAAERIVLEGSMSVTPDAPEERSFASVGRVFELAEEQGVGLVVLRPDDASATAAAPALSGNAFVRAALAEGLVVVGPAQAVDIDGSARIGWWEIDPTTGRARDRMDNGMGAELGEYAMKLHHIASQVACIIGIGVVIVSIAQAAYKNAFTAAIVAGGQCIIGGAH